MSQLSTKKNLLIISHDKIGHQMAGPGIRYHYMAQELADDFNVTVGFFDPSYLPDDTFTRNYEVLSVDAYKFEKSFQDKDVVIALWLSESMMNYCNQNNIFMAFDMYAPVPVENLASSIFSGKTVKKENDFEYQQSLKMYRKFFENGDLFLSSNQRQLDFWTGYVFGADQVRLSTYLQRPFFERMIYAPMGIDADTPLKKTDHVIRNVLPGVTNDSKVLLWTGGIWGWYDGRVLMRAMKRLQTSRPDIKLVFFGTQHPNPAIPEMKESLDTRQLAKDLGLTDDTVFFLDGWVQYDKRIDYLLEADVAINTHKPSIETEFSHRTRVLDHILAGLPTIGTEGDYLSDIVLKQQGLGIVVPPNDEEKLAQAIEDILLPENYNRFKKTLAEQRNSFDWSQTLKPLKEALLAGLPRLERLPNTRLKQSGKLYRLGKHILPPQVKKIIIRIIG